MNNDYIIPNEDWDSQEKKETVRMKNADLPEGLEIIEDKTYTEKALEDIQEAAKEEGLEGTENLGGEGASPEEVIAAMRAESMPEGAVKAKVEYEDKKIKEFKEITATRDMLFNRLKKPVKVYIDVGEDPATHEPVKMSFMVRKLSETENNHLLNHRLIGKKLNELTMAEYAESMAFRRRTLASTVIQPRLTEQEWADNVENGIIVALFDEVQKVLTDISDVDSFQ